MDPAVKRLAVQVEDHPLGYATFEGDDPEGPIRRRHGQDLGPRHLREPDGQRRPSPRTAAEAIEAGRIEFVMHGERLKGKFALIRMKPRGKGKPQWLLMKMKDEFAEAGSKEAPKPAAKSRAVKEARSAQARRTTRAPRSVELTHPDRIIYPDAGLTKEDVFTYYEKIAHRLLPFLKDRPITLERLPEGLAEKAPAFLAEGHAGPLPRLDSAYRTGDRAWEGRPLCPDQ